MARHWWVFVLIVMLLITSLWCVWGTAHEIYMGYVSTTWPTTLGRVTEARLIPVWRRVRRTRGRTVKLSLQYEYDAGGVHYAARTREFAGLEGPLGRAAREAQKRHPQGSPISVHYDPEDPGIAVLEPGVCWPPVLGLLASLLATGVLLYILWPSRRDPGCIPPGEVDQESPGGLC